jgi:hypothetical protein
MIIVGTYKILLKPGYKIEQLTKEIINSSESQIVIEVPGDCSLLTNEINLRLIKFYAEEEEKEIIIDAVDPVLLTLVQRLGLSAMQAHQLSNPQPEPGFFKPLDQGENTPGMDVSYPNAKEITISEPPVFERTTGKIPQYGRFLPAMIVLLFTLSVAIWWFLQPKAVVLVYPKEQALPFKATVQIGTAFTDADIPSGRVPAQNIEQQFKLAIQTPTTGHKIVGVTPAVGKALFINSSNQPVLVGKGSILYGRNGIHFSVDNDVLIPKKSTSLEAGIVVGESYGKVEASITAETKGTIGNQPAKSISGIEQKYQNYLKVTNPAPTRNGADKQVPVVTLEDVKNGMAEVKRQMELSYNDEARNLTNRDFLYLADLAKPEIIHIANKPEIGFEGDSLLSEIEYRVSVLAPSTVGIKKFLNKQFEQNIPAGFEAGGRKVDLVSMQLLAQNGEQADLELAGQGQIRGVLDQNKIKNLIKGKWITDAKEILIRQNEIADVRFKVDSLHAKLPHFGFQIRVLFPAGSKLNNRL